MKEFTRRGLILGAASLASYGVLTGVERLCISAFARDPSTDEDAGPVRIALYSDARKSLGHVSQPKVRKTSAEWKKRLTPVQYDITRRAATEFSFSGLLHDERHAGLYRCVDCDSALFDSRAKFDSGTGWPSFWEPIARENVEEKKDFSAGVLRTEVKCTLCDAHLGHVFNGGPKPTGLRYCMNSAALRFLPQT